MAKNNVRNAVPQDAAGDDSEVIVRDGAIDEAVKQPVETLTSDMAKDAEPNTVDKVIVGVRLHPDQSMNPAGQIAAMSAMRTAYQCVYGRNIIKKDLTAWAEGGIILPAQKRDADILVRICYALGVLAEVAFDGE